MFWFLAWFSCNIFLFIVLLLLLLFHFILECISFGVKICFYLEFDLLFSCPNSLRFDSIFLNASKQPPPRKIHQQNECKNQYNSIRIAYDIVLCFYDLKNKLLENSSRIVDKIDINWRQFCVWDFMPKLDYQTVFVEQHESTALLFKLINWCVNLYEFYFYLSLGLCLLVI